MDDTPTGQRAEKIDLLRSLLRVIGGLAVSYYVVVAGGFAHSVLIMIASGLAIAATLASLGLSLTRDSGWTALIPRIGMVLTGGLLSTAIGTPGWIIYGIGVVNLIGMAEPGLAAAITLVAIGGAPIVVDAGRNGGDTETVLLSALSVVGIGVLGYSRRLMRNRRIQDAELVERSRQLEQRSRELIDQTEKTRAETARAAALEERARIARDIHDLLAHSLGGLVVQLDAADALLAGGGDPEQVAERVRTSRRLAVEGLQEARAAVRELRSEESPPAVGAGGTAGADGSTADGQVSEGDRDRWSGADVVAEVLKIIRGPVGVQLGVDFDVVGAQTPVPARVAGTFAAVAREALTNINKHAPGCRTAGSLIFADGSVRLELINALPAPGGEDHRPLAGTGGGYGLAGMRQRLVDVGGTLSAGRQGDRWLVSASWPTQEG